ncbi:reverse transcriptase domain-containing protein [Clostridium thailandense]|uniref:reverse transcriptase domain-containing protein n=1 Tax=Clostridium thailandense TaxID=2794346 RepID=UPI003989DE86
MRNPLHVLKSLEEQSCNKEYKYERLYRNLYNPEFYLLAYNNIAKSQGSMTAGVDRMTLDGMSMARINKLIAMLKDHSYKPNPARREYITKKNSDKKRPLGIPSSDDKLIQEVVRMILEAIYEPTFSDKSHGFRPKRSCHTALLSIKTNFNGAKWIVEGDIKACFDSFDHHVLINILRRRIKDEQFISLMWKLLKAGYMEQWEYYSTYSGTPQGSGVSPILANIYLSELDVYMERYKLAFDTPNNKRSTSKEYNKARWKMEKCKNLLSLSDDHKVAIKNFKIAQQIYIKMQSYDVMDQGYKRVQYNRYADDFVVGIIGSKKDAEKLKQDIKVFLQNELKLTLSEEKTKVTHSSELIRYLGYDFTVSRSKDVKRNKGGNLQRYWYGRVKLYVPHEKWVGKLQEYKAFKVVKDVRGKEKWKSTHRGFLINKEDIEIISKYNSEIRGIHNYYRLAENVSVLNNFKFIMEGSMLKTFAAKYNSSASKVKESRMENGVFGVYYYNKAGKQRCEFYNDSFSHKEEAHFIDVDILPNFKRYDKTNSLANRLKSHKCEICGKSTDNLHIHHVKRLKDLTGKSEFELMMMTKRRKSLALCPDCFIKAHD